MTSIDEKIAWLQNLKKNGHTKIATAILTRDELMENWDFSAFLDDKFGKWGVSDAVDEAREAFADRAWNFIADSVEDAFWEAIGTAYDEAFNEGWNEVADEAVNDVDSPLNKELRKQRNKIFETVSGEKVDTDISEAFFALQERANNV